LILVLYRQVPSIFHINSEEKANGIILASQAKPSQAKPSQAKPNKTYYQMDNPSFAKGGVRRLQTPSLVKDSGKGVFCFDVYIVTSSHEFSRINSHCPFAAKIISYRKGDSEI